MDLQEYQSRNLPSVTENDDRYDKADYRMMPKEMKKNQEKICFLLIIAIGIIYFCAMIPANLTGAETPEMLEVFEVDEYAQYPHVIRMLTPGKSVYQSIRNFFIYLHYYYGFPFYFWSAVCLLPVRLFGGLNPENTRIIVCVLRQMLSVLPMILSAGLLTRTLTKFKNILLSVTLDILLLTMPAVIQNNFWWHPDSLTLLFLSLTFFFLDRDEMRCGKSFLFAAFACGAAIGTKYLGLYFALAIPAYLCCCRKAGTISIGQLFSKAGLFLLVMAAAVLFSDPLLLLPQERAEILGIMKQQTEMSGTGIFLQYKNEFFADGRLPDWLTQTYMRLPWLLLSLAALITGLFNKRSRTLSVVMLCYLLTACTVNLNTAASRLHYFLPILMPLASMLPLLAYAFPKDSRKYAEYCLCFLLLVQTGLNLPADRDLLNIQLNREENSGSIALYHTLESSVLPLPEVPPERMTRIYRDWKAYFPEQEGYAVKTDWELASFPLIEEWHPDLILLEKENIRAYSAEGVLDAAVNREKMAETSAFYSAAAEKAIPGYQFLLENGFGVVFRKELP